MGRAVVLLLTGGGCAATCGAQIAAHTARGTPKGGTRHPSQHPRAHMHGEATARPLTMRWVNQKCVRRQYVVSATQAMLLAANAPKKVVAPPSSAPDAYR